MAVTSDVNKIIYTCDATVTTYTFPFRILKETDLQVWLYDLTAGTKTQLVLNTDYTVAGVNVDTGGSITLTTAYDNTHKLLIYREVPYTQEVRYTEGDPFPAEEHEKALDKLTFEAQQLEEKISRAMLADAVTGDVDFNGVTVHNLGSAVADTDAANLGDVKANALPYNGTAYDAGTKNIINLANAVNATDAATLGDITTHALPYDATNGVYTAGSKKIVSLLSATDATDAANLGDIYANALSYDPTKTYYDAGGKAIKNVPNPTDGLDACNYQTASTLASGSVAIDALTQKSPVDTADEVVIADSADSYNNKKATLDDVVNGIVTEQSIIAKLEHSTSATALDGSVAQEIVLQLPTADKFWLEAEANNTSAVTFTVSYSADNVTYTTADSATDTSYLVHLIANNEDGSASYVKLSMTAGAAGDTANLSLKAKVFFTKAF